jgi:hypothetical protein
MGRAGLEPATLGLKVQPNQLRDIAENLKTLQGARITVATSCNKLRVGEASLYAHSYAHLSSSWATEGLAKPLWSEVEPLDQAARCDHGWPGCSSDRRSVSPVTIASASASWASATR